METIGTKITQLRKQKALSQEELADLAKINVRTVQRIENNETIPRGTTLKLICNALEATPDEIVNFEKVEDHTFLIGLHLSVMLGYVLPLGNIILPVVLWITNKNKIEDVNNHGSNIINYQILYSAILFLILLAGLAGILLSPTVAQSVFRYQLSLILFITFATLNFILPVFNCIRISRGNLKPFYPSIIRFIK